MELIQLDEDVIGETKIIETGKKIIEDFRTLNQILFKLQENFSLKDKKLREMSEQTNNEIRGLMDRIALNLKVIGNVLEKVPPEQVAPYSKEDMDTIMIRIMNQYMTTSVNIQIDSLNGKLYVTELNEIHSSLKDLSIALNNYNTLAKDKGWPELMSESEAFAEAKRLVQLINLPALL